MPRSQRTYDHRLVRLVQDTGDITIATGVGVPRSTAAGWLRRAKRDITTVSTCETSSAELRARLARVEARLRRCQALLRVLVVVLRIVQPDFTRLRVPLGADKARLLRAVDRARGVVRLPRLLRLIGLSPSRLAAWRHVPVGRLAILAQRLGRVAGCRGAIQDAAAAMGNGTMRRQPAPDGCSSGFARMS